MTDTERTQITGRVDDSFRTRIAAVLKEARIVTYWREGIDEADGQPYRSLVIRSDEQAAEYAADAVIREPTNPIRGCTDSWHWSTGEPYRCPTCGYWMGEGYV